MGSATVSSDFSQTLFVDVFCDRPIVAVHVHLGGPPPTNKGGNVVPGAFDHSLEAESASTCGSSVRLEFALGDEQLGALQIGAIHVEYVAPLALLPPGDPGANAIVIIGPLPLETESAWAADAVPEPEDARSFEDAAWFTGSKWGYWFTYTPCPPGLCF